MSSPNLAAVPPRHRLTIKELDSLAGGRFEPDAIVTLLSVERSRRMLLLRAVRHYASSRPDATGPLPSVDDAWDLLLRAERSNPQVVEELLAEPQIGTWVSHTLRRLRDMSDDQAPLWFHVGQLHSLAVAAAIRCGVNCPSFRIPVWNGVVQLPSLGYARLPVDTFWSQAEVCVDTVVEIRSAGGVVEVDPRSDHLIDGWFPAKLWRLSAEGQDLSIHVDDATLYRGSENPSAPTPLPAAEVHRWRTLLEDAWALLVRDHRERAAALAIGMSSITPIPAVFRFRPRSSSVEDGFGGAILSLPYDAAQLAVTLVHEFQHSVLNGIRHVAELVKGYDPPTGYAPWRDDPRPLGGIIHGVFAFTAIAEFWAVHRQHAEGVERDMANFELALWRRQAATVLRRIEDHPALTETGVRLLKGIATRLGTLSGLPVPHAISAIADIAAEDHLAAWRACHLRPDHVHVKALAAAWTAGRPAPPAGDARPSIQPDLSGQRLDAKAALIRVQLTDPDLFRRIRTEPQLVPGASIADAAFVAGEFDTAQRLYLKELSETPNRAGAWSGSGLTLAATGDSGMACTVLRQAHTLRALTTMLAETDRPVPSADELAAWLSQGNESVTGASGRCRS